MIGQTRSFYDGNLGAFAFLCTALALPISTQAAVIISPTGGTSGGNPGGQPIFSVSGLVEGDMFEVNWAGPDDTAATGEVTIETLTPTNVEITVTIENLSAPNGGNGDPRLTSFGLQIDDATGVNSATGGSALDNAYFNSNFPGFGDVNVCGSSGNNCAGGGSGGIDVGFFDTFTLNVDGNFGDTIELLDFALKVQGAPDGASYELAGAPIPEPTSIALGVIGALAVVARRRFA